MPLPGQTMSPQDSISWSVSFIGINSLKFFNSSVRWLLSSLFFLGGETEAQGGEGSWRVSEHPT